MPNRWTYMGVGLFWLVMMGWLVQRDVLPAFRHRDPPSYATVLARSPDEAPSRWTIELGGKRLGSAQTEVQRNADGTLLWRGTVTLSELTFRNRPRSAVGIQSEFLIRDDKLSSFEITVRFDETERALEVRGVIDGRVLKLNARGPSLAYEKDFLFDPRDMLAGIMSPLDRLPGLHSGQTWFVRELNPFTVGALEGSRAEVSGTDDILWDGELVRTWVVSRQYGGVQARIWVRDDGTILRQEMPMLWTMLTLVRQPDHTPEAADD